MIREIREVVEAYFQTPDPDAAWCSEEANALDAADGYVALDRIRAILDRIEPPTFVCPSCGRLGRDRTPGYRGPDPQCPDCFVKAEAGRARLNAAYTAKGEGTATPEQERLVATFEGTLNQVLVPVEAPAGLSDAGTGGPC